MKEHCWCNMRDPQRGTMVDPNDADHIRDGIPICGHACLTAYDRNQDTKIRWRHELEEGRVNGSAVP